MKLELKRFEFTENSIIGKLYIDGQFECYTLENPYLDNKNNISSIPTGFYQWRVRDGALEGSKYDYKHIHVMDVPNRSWILVHIGNYPGDTLGCILPGTSYDRDAVWNSKIAFDKLMGKVSEDGTLIVSNEK